VAKQWQEELDDIKANRPLFMATALFRQWYLNEWVVDEDAKVYKFGEANKALDLPKRVEPYHYVLGNDMAHSPDSTAFVVSAYHDEDPTLYFVYARKHLKMDLTALANERHRLNEIYNFEVEIADGSNKIALAELNNRLKCRFLPADKTGKSDFIRLMNDEFIQQRIKLLPGAYDKHEKDVDSLADKYSTLVWETDNGKVIEPRKEHPGLHNDLCDGALYNWRYCYSYLFKPKLKEPDPRSQAVWEKKHTEKLSQEIQAQQNPNNWNHQFEPDEDLFDLERDDLI
jgi:hypothetical protein